MSWMGNMPGLLAVLQSEGMGDPSMRVFAENLRRLRDAAGLTQEALADRSGVARPTIANYERGASANVEMATLAALAGALGCQVADLVRELPSGYAVIADLLDSYLERWAKIDAPTDAELAWLRGLSPTFWFGGEPTPDSVHDLILHYRKRHASL
jgi:transcriptional regulator with XRE-family HTH domain